MAEGEKWFCPNCGHENRAGARFCSRCRTANPNVPVQGVEGMTRRMGAPEEAPASGARGAAQELMRKIGNVQYDGLQHWLLLRYQQLPAVSTAAEQVARLALPEWVSEGLYVSDYLNRAADQLNPSKRYSISFVGRNGLGKSTLANSLLGASYLPEAFREPVTAAVTRVRAMRDRPSPDELRAQGAIDPNQATVQIEYFNEESFLNEVLSEYYRRLNSLQGVNIPQPQHIDNNALKAASQWRGKLRDFPEAATNAATLESMLDAFLRARNQLPRYRWMSYEEARHKINEKEAQGVERDLLRLTREVTYFVDDSMTPEPLLTNYGIELIDLPGLEAEVSYHELTTLRALNEADAVIVVLQARRPVEKNTLAALAELARRKGWSDEYRERFGAKVFVVLNRSDEIDLQAGTINEYFGNNREGLDRIIRDMIDPVLPNYWGQHRGVDAAPYYLVSGYGALYAQQQMRIAKGDPLAASSPSLFPSLKERGDLIYRAYETIAGMAPTLPRPRNASDYDWLLKISGMPQLKTDIGTFVRMKRFSASLEQAGQGIEDARRRMRDMLVRFLDSRGVTPDQYDRYRQMGTDIQVAWDRVDRLALSLRAAFTESILATQSEFPNRPDPAKPDRLTARLDDKIGQVKSKLADSLSRNEADLRSAATQGGTTMRPARTLEDLISSTPDLVNQASILQADRAANLVLDLRTQLDNQFASSAPEMASIMSDGFESKLNSVGFSGKLKRLTYDQQDVWTTADSSYRRMLSDLRTRYADMVRTVLLRDLIDPANSMEDDRSTVLKALAAQQQQAVTAAAQPKTAQSKQAQPPRERRGGLFGVFDQEPEPAPQPEPQAAPANPTDTAPVQTFSQTYSLSLMVIETIQVELRRTRDIATSTARARALVQQAFGMLAERMRAVVEPLKRLYWLELSRLQDTASRQGTVQDIIEDTATEIKKRIVSDTKLKDRVLSEPDPDEAVRNAIAALDTLEGIRSQSLKPELRSIADELMRARV